MQAAAPEATAGHDSGAHRALRVITQRVVETVVQELNREDVKARVKDHVISPLIDILNQEDTKRRINEHIVLPLIRLLYTQLFPYLVLAALVILCGMIMWILMFTMFTLSYMRARH